MIYDGTCRPSELGETRREDQPTRARKGTRELIVQVLARVEVTPSPSWEDTVQRVRAFAVSELHKATGIGKRTLQRYMKEECRARGKHLAALLAGLPKLETERGIERRSHERGQVADVSAHIDSDRSRR